jgi:hypothetical protein
MSKKARAPETRTDGVMISARYEISEAEEDVASKKAVEHDL